MRSLYFQDLFPQISTRKNQIDIDLNVFMEVLNVGYRKVLQD